MTDELQRQVSDVTVGVLKDGPMRCRVSVRGGCNVILAFARDGRAVEVVFSPKATRQLLEIAEAAAKLAEGVG